MNRAMRDMAPAIEILAPAGGPEALRAAVFAGADAVYLGGPVFSARASAENFTRESLREGMAFLRERGVKCYVAVNILIKDSEMDEALDFAKLLCEIGADGIIVQDLGLMALLHKCCPNLPLHCSTQMSLHSPEGLALVKELGAVRAVLARELSLKEIQEIHRNVDIELEAFVHGALCMSVSGQCYFSAMLGGRSGNRGRCAQTCRLPFSAPGGVENALSLKDLSFLQDIAELSKAGVCSAKIEGRMKRPEYVAAATRAACLARDKGEIPGDLQDSLEAVFSRSGFTNGYLRGKLNRDMFGIRTKADVLSGSYGVMGKLHAIYQRELQRVPLCAKLKVFAGQPPVLKLWDNDGNSVRVQGEQPVEQALNRPLSSEELKERISKMGGTPYYAPQPDCHTDGKSALSASCLNSLRRQALDKLGEIRRSERPIEFRHQPMPVGVPAYKSKKIKLRAEFAGLNQAPEDVTMLEWVYLPLEAPKEDFVELMGRGARVGAVMPRAMFGAEDELKKAVKQLMAMGITAFVCGNLGSLALVRKLGGTVHGGYSLNIANLASLNALKELGLESAELSFEISLQEIGRLGGDIPRGIMVYGRQALMLTRLCPIMSCKNCPGHIVDRKGISFPVSCTRLGGKQLCTQIFNSLPLSLSDKMGEISGADYGVLRFTVENHVETGEIIGAVLRQEVISCDYTRGRFVQSVI